MTNAKPDDFSHFVAAQKDVFSVAMEELRAGAKTSHWMWFVFPILSGLRMTAMSMRYALAGPGSAAQYLEHPVLGPRLLEAVAVVHQQVCGTGVPVPVLMGSRMDAQKLVSSLTLFEAVASQDTLVQHARAVLKAAEAQGIPPCAHTLAALAAA